MRKASLNTQVYVTLLAWFTMKSLIYNSLHNHIPTNIHVPKYKYVHKVLILVLVARVTQPSSETVMLSCWSHRNSPKVQKSVLVVVCISSSGNV